MAARRQIRPGLITPARTDFVMDGCPFWEPEPKEGSTPYKDKSKNDACKRAWRLNNPKRMAECRREWAKNNPQIWTQSEYGLSQEEYLVKLKRQNNLCGLCHLPFDLTSKMSSPALDHDHDTGLLRDFVHQSCNLGIGFLRDNPELCRLAAAYLEQHKTEEPCPQKSTLTSVQF